MSAHQSLANTSPEYAARTSLQFVSPAAVYTPRVYGAALDARRNNTQTYTPSLLTLAPAAAE